MAKILVVANRTLGGDHLLDVLRERIKAGECSIHVVVPAGPAPEEWLHSEEGDHAAAQARLDDALERFGQLGCEVTGEVGDERPVDAVGDVLRRDPFDEVIVSTFPAGISRWLRADLVSRIERSVGIPVTHVVAAEEGAASR